LDEERTFLAHAQTDAHDPLRKWSVHCCGRTIPPQESGFIFEDEVYFGRVNGNPSTAGVETKKP
jgi:hypothetical protein